VTIIADIHNNFPRLPDLPSDPGKTSAQLGWPPFMQK